MTDKIDVLDHGFVALRNLAGPTRRVWGDAETFDGVEDEGPYDVRKQRPFDADDIDPANAARMSFDQTDSGRTREQDLHNIMHFLSLRDHGHAQVEAQAYAKAVDKLLRTYLPATMDLYDQFRRLP